MLEQNVTFGPEQPKFTTTFDGEKAFRLNDQESINAFFELFKAFVNSNESAAAEKSTYFDGDNGKGSSLECKNCVVYTLMPSNNETPEIYLVPTCKRRKLFWVFPRRWQTGNIFTIRI